MTRSALPRRLLADRHPGRAGLHAADDGGVGEAFARKQRQHLASAGRVAGNEQATRGLRVGQQGLLGRRDAGADGDVLAVGVPIAP